MKEKKYLDLSGFSFTGKSAYNNVFAEFSGFDAHAFDVEFDLVRTKDGILDLHTALIENWSPVRSSEAIRAFGSVIDAYRGDGSFIQRLTKIGRRYDQRFPGFFDESNAYVNDLIDASWVGEWPFAFERFGRVEVSFRKILFSLGLKRAFEAKVFLSAPSEEYFISRTKAYLNAILTAEVPSDCNTVVMNNVLEPFNPLPSMRFFSNIKSIVIDRDPRDIYLAAWDYTNKDGSKGWRATLGNDVEDFVQRFKAYRKHVSEDTNPDLLRVSFEDLVINYEDTLQKLYAFLNVDASIHEQKGRCFVPEVSSRGVGLWKKNERKEDIVYIYEQLHDYCKYFD